MKRAIFILTLGLCLLLSDGAHAQRALPAMRGLEIRGGMADGFYTRDSRSETGYWFGLAMSRYAKNADKWVFGAEFLNRYYPYKSERIPVAQFTAEGGYYYKFLADPSRTFFFYLGGSALAGYESVNRGERRLYDGSTLLAKDAFIYGGAITLELESYITDRIVLLANVRERVLWGGSLGKFSTQFGLGVKFIIN